MLFRKARAKSRIFWNVYCRRDFTIEDIRSEYPLTEAEVRELCKPHIAKQFKGAIIDRRIYERIPGSFQCIGHYGSKILFPIGSDKEINPFLARLDLDKNKKGK